MTVRKRLLLLVGVALVEPVQIRDLVDDALRMNAGAPPRQALAPCI